QLLREPAGQHLDRHQPVVAPGDVRAQEAGPGEERGGAIARPVDGLAQHPHHTAEEDQRHHQDEERGGNEGLRRAYPLVEPLHLPGRQFLPISLCTAVLASMILSTSYALSPALRKAARSTSFTIVMPRPFSCCSTSASSLKISRDVSSPALSHSSIR